MAENVRTLIIGSGPAGYTAAIYSSRASLSPVVYEGMEPGGQLTTTTVVENYPGFPEGVDANMLMDSMKKQAMRFGADVRRGRIKTIDLSSRPFLAVDDKGNEILASSVIVATGAVANGDFETGDCSGWTISGGADVTYTVKTDEWRLTDGAEN